MTTKVEEKSRLNDRDFINKSFDKNKEKNKKRQKSRERYRINKRNKSNDYKDKEKVKIFFAKQKNASKSQQNSDIENYHHFENVEYFNSNQKKSNFENAYVNISMILNVLCRTCKSSFSFNNAFHSHLRRNKNCAFRLKFINISNDESDLTKISSDQSIYLQSFKDNKTIISIIQFKVDFNQDIDTEYEFKSWQFVTTELSLNLNAISTSDCVNSKTEITLSDIDFFKKQTKNLVFIRIMIISITIRGLETNKHITDRYAMISMYFKEKDKQGNEIRAVITRKIHLINDLKANILLENDVLDSELFDIFMSKSTAYIESCDVTISILITNQRSFKTKSVHSTKIKIIASNSEQLIFIHKIFASDRNYLFESSQTANVSVYAHMLDNDINSILIRNNCDRSIKISRNFKLSMLSESYYINAFQIDTNMSELALKTFKFEHKISWFKKIFVVVTAYAANISQKSNDFHQIETLLINDIIIHNFSFQAVKVFINLLNEYHIIWTD